MNKFSTLLLALGTAASVASAQKTATQKPALSPLTRHYLLEAQQQLLPEGYSYRTDDNGRRMISAMIKVSDAALAGEGLKGLEAAVGVKAGNVWTVQVPVSRMTDFTALPGIAYIQLDEPVFPKMDQEARKATRVDSVHRGIGLPMVYSGKGVVVGIIDFGFDYNHPSFYDTSGTRYRVKKVWELNSNGTHPTGFSYGRELADTNAIKAATTDNSVQTHGTCVAGMAAGSGYAYSSVSNNARYRGVAYDADMVLVGVRRDSIAGQWMQGSFSDFANSISYILNYAASVSKPAVVNISWGSQSGAHDGTSLFNQACDNMSGPGKLIVMSAGNEGQEHIHLSKTFTATDTMISTHLTFTPGTYQRTWVDVWGQPGKTFCGKATLYRNGAPVSNPSFICLDNNTHIVKLIGSGGTDTCIVEYINTTSDPNNTKPRMTINVFNKTTDTVRIDIKAVDGTVHMWNEYYYYGYDRKYQSAFSKLGQPWATEGDTISTVSDMGAAQSVLLVGAYVSKNSWSDLNRNGWTYTYDTTGKLARFSSVGPMIDGRIKPDITAPGLTIATASSSYDADYLPGGGSSQLLRAGYQNPATGRTYYYSEFSGTSAASPAAAGITALLLQAKPTLTPAELKTLLTETAIQDSYTGALPAAGVNNWGHGKINAYGAVKRLAQQTGVYTYQGRRQLDCVIYPNPGTGSYVLDYTGAKSELLQLQVVDIKGATAIVDTWQVSPGTNRRALDLSALAKGTYFVRIAGREGVVSMKTVLQ